MFSNVYRYTCAETQLAMYVGGTWVKMYSSTSRKKDQKIQRTQSCKGLFWTKCSLGWKSEYIICFMTSIYLMFYDTHLSVIFYGHELKPVLALRQKPLKGKSLFTKKVVSSLVQM